MTVEMTRLCRSAAVAALLCSTVPAQSAASALQVADVNAGQSHCARFPEVRQALVIGNSLYLHTSVLNNPSNDSVDIAASLRELCFEVSLVNDVDLLSFERELREFREKARDADLALVFYAGHGIEIGGRNYLIPVDAELKQDLDVDWEAIALDRVLRSTAGAGRQIVILDACRDNPLARSMQRSVLSRGSLGSGLAPPGTIDNQLVAFAASAGNTAADGRGRNSPYSEALLQHLREPGLEINLLFGKVRDTVRATTEAQQVPGFYNQLPGEPYYLNPGFAVPAVSEPETAAVEATAVNAATAVPADAPVGRVLESVVKGQMPLDCNYCPQLTIVPPGLFLMGAAASDLGREEDEGPLHLVTIPEPLAVGVYEVTFSEWDACVDRGRCRHRPGDQGWGRSQRPVINVSWIDAQAYVEWLSEETGERYRLLSEAEWEYVARAGSGAAQYWSEQSAPVCMYANAADASSRSSSIRWPEDWTFQACGDGFAVTAPTGSFSSNRFGLRDTLGNVWEWTQDCWNERHSREPTDSRSRETGDCGKRVVRGAAWNSQPVDLRASVRDGIPANTRANNLGFRVVRTLERPEADASDSAVSGGSIREASSDSAPGPTPTSSEPDRQRSEPHD